MVKRASCSLLALLVAAIPMAIGATNPRQGGAPGYSVRQRVSGDCNVTIGIASAGSVVYDFCTERPESPLERMHAILFAIRHPTAVQLGSLSIGSTAEDGGKEFITANLVNPSDMPASNLHVEVMDPASAIAWRLQKAFPHLERSNWSRMLQGIPIGAPAHSTTSIPILSVDDAVRRVAPPQDSGWCLYDASITPSGSTGPAEALQRWNAHRPPGAPGQTYLESRGRAITLKISYRTAFGGWARVWQTVFLLYAPRDSYAAYFPSKGTIERLRCYG
jgi:hypothetical protein